MGRTPIKRFQLFSMNHNQFYFLLLHSSKTYGINVYSPQKAT